MNFVMGKVEDLTLQPSAEHSWTIPELHSRPIDAYMKEYSQIYEAIDNLKFKEPPSISLNSIKYMSRKLTREVALRYVRHSMRYFMDAQQLDELCDTIQMEIEEHLSIYGQERRSVTMPWNIVFKHMFKAKLSYLQRENFILYVNSGNDSIEIDIENIDSFDYKVDSYQELNEYLYETIENLKNNDRIFRSIKQHRVARLLDETAEDEVKQKRQVLFFTQQTMTMSLSQSSQVSRQISRMPTIESIREVEDRGPQKRSFREELMDKLKDTELHSVVRKRFKIDEYMELKNKEKVNTNDLSFYDEVHKINKILRKYGDKRQRILKSRKALDEVSVKTAVIQDVVESVEVDKNVTIDEFLEMIN